MVAAPDLAEYMLLCDKLGAAEAQKEAQELGAEAESETVHTDQGWAYIQAHLDYQGIPINELRRVDVDFDAEHVEVERQVRFRIGVTAALIKHGLVTVPERTDNAQ